jgi:glycosyltransferase involved in cell wall biosynthesis
VSDPLVSVLVPAYNGERFLRPALLSALQQTYRHIEVVVGDDASTDGTAEILASFEAADPRVRVIRHQTNLGGFENPVRLLESARGEYIKFLLHDDLLAPDCVETLLAGLRSSPTASLAFSHREVIDEDGRPVAGRATPAILPKPGLIEGVRLGDVILESCQNIVGELTTTMFRRADVDLGTLWQIDGRRLAGNGDVALWLRLLTRGKAFYSPRTLSSFRTHSGQSTQDVRVHMGAVRDWALLVDWGRRQGFLADELKQRGGHAAALRMAAVAYAQLAASPHSATLLEAIFLSTARLIEMGTHPPADCSRPLSDRAHGAALLDRFTQELDVWSQTYPVALAAPALDAAEVGATMDAFRKVIDARAATRLVMAADPAILPRMAALAETAISEGQDIDVELVPTDDPSALLGVPWLAVVPRGGAWHRNRAAAVWSIDLPGPL